LVGTTFEIIFFISGTGSGLYSSFFTLTSPSICFGENTKILAIENNIEKYVPIIDLKNGQLIKTLRNGFVPLKIKGKNTIYNSGDNKRIKEKLYKLSKTKYPELIEDLYITGCHSVLVDNITAAERQMIEKELGKIYVTDQKYRLPACVDVRAEPYDKEGTYSIYHLALEDSKNENRNYGIFADGLLVESCFEKTILKNMSRVN
jgi:hypothetical protein